MRRLSVKHGTICSLCTDHHDDEFVWSDVVQEPICIGCSYEIYYGLEFKEQPSVNTYNNYLTINRLLIHCGISFDEARKRHFKELISSLQGRQSYLKSLLDSEQPITVELDRLAKDIDSAEESLQYILTGVKE